MCGEGGGLLSQPRIPPKMSEQSRAYRKNKVIVTKGSVHVTTVKVFVGVSILFIASYIPVIISQVTANPHTVSKLLYMINHVGNPIIYYGLNKKFRNDVSNLFIEWFSPCCRKC